MTTCSETLGDSDRSYPENAPNFVVCFRELRRFFSRRVRHDEVEDLVSQAFLALMEREVASGAPRSPRAYLFAIANNLVRQEIRRRVRYRRVFDDLAVFPGEGPSRGCSEAQAAVLQLEMLLGRLNDIDRDALLLRRVDGCELEHIATHLGVSRSTVQRRVASADRFLRKSAARHAMLADFL